MTKTKRDEIINAMNATTIEPEDSMTVVEMCAFAKGYQLAHENMIYNINNVYKNMRTD